MEQLNDIINKLFYDFLYPKNCEKDILLKDLEILKKFDIYDKPNSSIIHSKNINFKIECNINTNEYLTKNEISTVFNEIKNETNQINVEKKLDKIIYKNLPSSIQNLEAYLNIIKNNNTSTNILILGAGPNGLFLANYLWGLYKNYYNKINILIIDNRIDKEGFRLPYTRSRIFAIGKPSYLSYILPTLSCFSENTTIQIKYLEILLYLKLFQNNIPLYFTNKYNDYKNIEKLIKKYNFKICFDSTGNRIKTPFIVNDFKIPKQIQLSNHNYSLMLENNLIKHIWDEKDYKFRYYLFIYFLNDEYKNVYFEYDTYIINNHYDYELFKDFCIDKKNINKILPQDKQLKIFLNKIYKMIEMNSNIIYLNFKSMEIKMYHQLKISFLINNNKTLWISSGDTLFHSHFLLGSGLYRTLPINVKISNLLEIIL